MPLLVRDKFIIADEIEESNNLFDDYMNTSHTIEWEGVYSFEDEYPDNYSEARVNASFDFHISDRDKFNEQILSDYFLNSIEDIDDTLYEIIGSELDYLYEEFIEEYDDYSEVDSSEFLQEYLNAINEFCDGCGLELDDYSFEPDDDICFDEYEDDDYEDDDDDEYW